MSVYDGVDVFVELFYYLDVLPTNVDVVYEDISCILYIHSSLYYIVTNDYCLCKPLWILPRSLMTLPSPLLVLYMATTESMTLTSSDISSWNRNVKRSLIIRRPCSLHPYYECKHQHIYLCIYIYIYVCVYITERALWDQHLETTIFHQQLFQYSQIVMAVHVGVRQGTSLDRWLINPPRIWLTFLSRHWNLSIVKIWWLFWGRWLTTQLMQIALIKLNFAHRVFPISRKCSCARKVAKTPLS
jgi:hypothetical protein